MVELFENTLKDAEEDGRFFAEIRFSAGAVCDAQLAEFPENMPDEDDDDDDEDDAFEVSCASRGGEYGLTQSRKTY